MVVAAGDPVRDRSGPVESELIRRVVTGDETALTVVLAQSRARLARYLAFKIPVDLQGLISPDDIVQETHTAVFRKIHAFLPQGPDSFDRWVRAVAVGQLRSAVRRQRAAKRGGGRVTIGEGQSVEDSSVALFELLGGPANTPSRCVARKEAVGAIQTAVKGLPEHYRQAIWLVHIEGRPIHDVAVQMGRTHRAVSGLCRRGMKLLRVRLVSASRFLSSSD
jgi:RNA polymerase sigma-70 factor (subfamily 1)